MPPAKSAECFTPADSSRKPTLARPGLKPQKPTSAAPEAKAPAPVQPGPTRYRLIDPDLAPEIKNAGMLAASSVFNSTAVMVSLRENLTGAEATAESLMMAVDEQVAKVQAGDMSEVEGMLLSQALSLQTIYASLTRRATSQQYLKQYQTYLTLALKAQAQSRATLEALIELKQPRHAPTFIKQANMANGPQQVNNGAAPSVQPPAHAADIASAPNKLLEADSSPTLDRVDKGVNKI